MTALPLSAKCIKYLLFLFNLLFVITGIIILSVGAVVHGIYNTYSTLLDGGYLSTSAFLVAIGFIIFVIAFFGCCGAVKDNMCMITTFTALLIMVFIFELSAGISGYVLRDNTTAVIEKSLMGRMTEYKSNNETQKMFDIMQTSFQCCGVKNWTDWATTLNLTEYTVPVSCCGITYGAMNYTMCSNKENEFFDKPCLHAFGDFISNHAVTLGGCALGLAFIQLLGIIFSCYLARTIKRNYESV